jgi:hypothetical protein
MAYVPQFIPTNTQVLQGTLDQYQKGYDTNTAMQNQVNDAYSSIPTTRPYDTNAKNKIMDQFSDKLDELDKKYNYDRSNQNYARELASNITDLRSNPLWAHIQQKDEIAKERQKLIAERGVNYHENVDPNTATLDNQTPLTSWKPVNLMDVKSLAASWAKEFATSQTGESVDKSQPGWIKTTTQYGPRDMGEAINFLNGNKKLNGLNGPEELNRIISSAGFDPNDPAIKNAAHEAFLTEAVGKQTEKWEEDHAYLAEQARLAKQKPGIIPVQTGNGIPLKGTAVPYAVNNMKDAAKLDADIKSLRDKVNTENTPILNYQLQDLQKKRDDVNSVVASKESLPANQKIIDTGHQEAINSVLNQYKTFIAGDKSQAIYDILQPFFNNTTAAGRSSLNPFTKNDKSKAAIQVAQELQKYTDPGRKVNPNIINSIAREVVDSFADWHAGTGNFAGRGYNTIKDQVNKELNQGRQPLYNEYSLPSSMEKGTEKGEILKFIADNTHALTNLDGSAVAGKGANTLAEAFKNENTQFHWLTDNEGSVVFHLNYPGDETGTNKKEAVEGYFKINPATASYGFLKDIANRTGDQGILGQFYSNFNLSPNKEYSVSDKDGYLASKLGMMFPSRDRKGNITPDIKAFQNFKIRYIEDPATRETRYEVTTPDGVFPADKQ